MPHTSQHAIAEAPALPELSFAVEGAAPVEFAAAPTLEFALRVSSSGPHVIRSVLLDTQIQIAARRRPYDTAEEQRLFDLFGPTSMWATSLRTLLWTRVTTAVPAFRDSTVVRVPVACSYDLDVTASRYFDALAGGAVPLELLFSGTVFYAGEDGRLQTARISWEQEAEYRLPVAVWRDAIDRHFPGAAWLRLRRESFDRLRDYRSRRALATWEDALDALLDKAEEEA